MRNSTKGLLFKKLMYLVAIVALMALVAAIKLHRINDHMVKNYSDEGGIYTCSKRIQVEDYQAYGNSYKLETFQRPVDQAEAAKHCKLEAAF